MSSIRIAVLGQLTAFGADGAELDALRRRPKLLSRSRWPAARAQIGDLPGAAALFARFAAAAGPAAEARYHSRWLEPLRVGPAAAGSVSAAGYPGSTTRLR